MLLLSWFLLVQGVVFHMWFFLMIFPFVFLFYIQRDVIVRQHSCLLHQQACALAARSVARYHRRGAFAWGRHVQQPRLIVVKAAVRYMLGKDCFVIVVEDYDNGEIFVCVRNFEQMKRLSSVTMFVGGDSVIFTHVDRLSAICQPSDMSPLGKMRCFRH